MFTGSPSNQVRPVCVLLGGSGMRRVVEPKKPDVGVLLASRTDRRMLRSIPTHFVAPPWEVDCHDLDREQASAIVFEVATDDPELVLEKIRQLKQSGEIGPDDLAHVEIASHKWLKISRDNRERGRR